MYCKYESTNHEYDSWANYNFRDPALRCRCFLAKDRKACSKSNHALQNTKPLGPIPCLDKRGDLIVYVLLCCPSLDDFVTFELNMMLFYSFPKHAKEYAKFFSSTN